MAWLVAFLLAQGCNSRYLDPGPVPALQPDEGLVGFVIRTEASLYDFAVHGCRKVPGGVRPDGVEVGTGWIDRGESFHLLRVPSGLYCVSSVDFTEGHWAGYGEAPCFEVRAAKTNYVGHIEIGVPAGEGLIGRFHWDFLDEREDFERVLRARYPGAPPVEPAYNEIMTLSLAPFTCPGCWRQSRMPQTSAVPSR